jgi:hypothetical protein
MNLNLVMETKGESMAKQEHVELSRKLYLYINKDNLPLHFSDAELIMGRAELVGREMTLYLADESLAHSLRKMARSFNVELFYSVSATSSVSHAVMDVKYEASRAATGASAD